MNLLIITILAFALGVALQITFKLTLIVAVWLAVLSLASVLIWRKKGKQMLPLLVCLVLIGVTLGIVRAETHSQKFGHSSLASSVEQEIVLKGTINQEPDYREKTVQLEVQTADTKVLVSTERYHQFKYGDEIRVSGLLEEPGTFTTDLGRTFDYQGYLLAQGVEFRMSFAEVELIQANERSSLLNFLFSTKDAFIKEVQQIIPEPEIGLGIGLLLGVKSALGDEIETDFRKTGIIHIVVLSGYNVMLVVAFILFFLSFLLPIKWRLVFGLLAIVCFALLVGLSATVVRASIMAGLVLFAQSFGKKYDVLRALFIAGLIMLLINPYLLIYDIGFQLSFMATLGLILVVPHFESTVVNKKLVSVREFFLATLATQIAVLPLLLYQIGEISLVAVIVNVLVLPIVPFAMLLTFLTGVLATISFELATLVGWAATFTLGYILQVADWFAGLPFAALNVPEFEAVWVFVMYGAMAIIYYYFKSYKDKDNNKDKFSDWAVEEEKEDDFLEMSSKKSSSRELPIFFR